jgi:hypothetical protein
LVAITLFSEEAKIIATACLHEIFYFVLFSISLWMNLRVLFEADIMVVRLCLEKPLLCTSIITYRRSFFAKGACVGVFTNYHVLPIEVPSAYAAGCIVL